MYSCPKHPAVQSDKPGKCPKCGATLNVSPKEKMKMGIMKMYTCPMHAEVTSKKPGKCPTCGIDMVEVK
jgi:transcription initiation factor IIE alpha subunit